MGYKKPKKKLGKFLGDETTSFSRSKLIKYGIAAGTAIIGASFFLNNVGIANSHSNTSSTTVSWEAVPGNPYCQRLVPSHVSHDAHANHSNHANHWNY